MTLAEYEPVRLALREVNGVTFTEIGEALRLIRTGYWRPVPLVSGSMSASIYTERVVCGRRGFEIVAPGRKRFGSILSCPKAAPRRGRLRGWRHHHAEMDDDTERSRIERFS